jgi:hypothetical protein
MILASREKVRALGSQLTFGNGWFGQPGHQPRPPSVNTVRFAKQNAVWQESCWRYWMC